MSEQRPGQTATRWRVPFFSIWTGQQLSLIGSELAGFALVWWLTETTGSATVLATATLVQMLPGVVLGPFVGALVDRWNRQRVMIVADSLIALLSAWLAYLFWADALQIWHVYLIMAARAIGGAFHWPAMSASTSLMVPDEHLSRVAGLNQAMRGILAIASPPLGALLLSLLPLHGIMTIDVASAAFAIAPLFFVRIPQPQRPAPSASEKEASKPSLWEDVREGLRYVWDWTGLRAVLFMAMIINFVFTPAGSLMPILVTRRFGGTAVQLGWMNSAWGIGLVLGGLTLSAWGGFKRRIATSLVGLIGMGVGAMFVGIVPATAFWLALGALFAVGFMNPITNGPLNAILQSVVAPEMQGRVFSVIGSAASAMAPLGMVIAGPVADAAGVHIWFVMSGVACISMAIWGFLSPAVMGLEDNRTKPTVIERDSALTVPARASGGAE